MVSTRGVKSKFHEGEKVLCYEPDVAKAKVLYDSKILEVKNRRDSKGRRVSEYLVHFNGWNSSWDRFVSEDLILKDNFENRKLQQKLSTEAILQLKQKKKRQKAAEILKLADDKKKKILGKPKKETAAVVASTVAENVTSSSSDDDQSDTLIIPDGLKECLEKDYEFIKKKKVLKLPCKPNVVAILEEYVQHYSEKVTSQSKEDESSSATTSINLCQEVVDGLRIYFDFTLPHLLLYSSEKSQYEKTLKLTKNTLLVGHKKNENDLPESNVDSGDCTNSIHTSSKCENSELSNVVNGDEPCRPPSSEDSKEPNVKIEPCKKIVLHSLMVLRSSAATTAKCEPVEQECNNTLTNLVENTEELRPKALNPPVLLNGNVSTDEKPDEKSDDKMQDSLHPAFCLTTSALKKNWETDKLSSLLNRGTPEKFSLTMVPPDANAQNVIYPSSLYGVQHLLRLFVKLPELLARVDMNPQKSEVLHRHLHLFLNYLHEKKTDFFLDDAYVDIEDDPESAVR